MEGKLPRSGRISEAFPSPFSSVVSKLQLFPFHSSSLKEYSVGEEARILSPSLYSLILARIERRMHEKNNLNILTVHGISHFSVGDQ